jgi:hypothetical protein
MTTRVKFFISAPPFPSRGGINTGFLAAGEAGSLHVFRVSAATIRAGPTHKLGSRFEYSTRPLFRQ